MRLRPAALLLSADSAGWRRAKVRLRPAALDDCLLKKFVTMEMLKFSMVEKKCAHGRKKMRPWEKKNAPMGKKNVPMGEKFCVSK